LASILLIETTFVFSFDITILHIWFILRGFYQIKNNQGLPVLIKVN
jgi:hypothetical protein